VPIFFLVYINDISYSVPPEVSTKLFADELKSYVSVAHGQSTVAFSIALDELTKWSNAWQLPISWENSCYMVIYNISCDEANGTFHLADKCLEKYFEVKDLGVLFNSHLIFSNHMSSLVKKSKQRLFLLNKCFVTKDPVMLILAFKTYIIPLLDCCSVIWSLHAIIDINQIESVQSSLQNV